MSNVLVALVAVALGLYIVGRLLVCLLLLAAGLLAVRAVRRGRR
ncbi:hypothetical protein [Streptomyces qinglanensis]